MLQPFVTGMMPDLAPWLPLLAIPFDAEVDATPEASALDPAASRDKLHWAVETFLERILMMPTLLVIEDGHWLDDASRFLLAHLVRQPAMRPWLVCVTTRPGRRADRAGRTTTARGSSSSRSPERPPRSSRSPWRRSSRSRSRRSARSPQRSGGNPLFVRELVFAAAARRVGRRAAGDGREPADDADRHARPGRPDAAALRGRRRPDVRARPARARSSPTRSRRPGDPERWAYLGEFVVPADGETLSASATTSSARRPTRGSRSGGAAQIHGRVGAGARAARRRRRPTSRRRSSRSTSTRPATTSARGATACSRASAREASFANVDRGRAVRAGARSRRAPRRRRRGGAGARATRRSATSASGSPPTTGPRSAYATAQDARRRRPDRSATRLTRQDRHACYERSGRYDEALEAYEAGLAAARRTSTARTLPRSAPGSSIGQAGIRYRQTRYEESIAAALAAIEHAERAENPQPRRARVLHPRRGATPISARRTGCPTSSGRCRSTRSCATSAARASCSTTSASTPTTRAAGTSRSTSTARAARRRSASAT